MNIASNDSVTFSSCWSFIGKPNGLRRGREHNGGTFSVLSATLVLAQKTTMMIKDSRPKSQGRFSCSVSKPRGFGVSEVGQGLQCSVQCHILSKLNEHF